MEPKNKKERFEFNGEWYSYDYADVASGEYLNAYDIGHPADRSEMLPPSTNPQSSYDGANTSDELPF